MNEQSEVNGVGGVVKCSRCKELESICDEFHRKYIDAKQNLTSTALAIVEAERDYLLILNEGLSNRVDDLIARLEQYEKAI